MRTRISSSNSATKIQRSFFPGSSGQSYFFPPVLPDYSVVTVGPIEQARLDCSEAATRTSERIKIAIEERDRNGIVPHDVDDALHRFFRGTDFSKLEELLSRIEPMVDWILNIPVNKIPVPVPPGPFQGRHTLAINGGVPAQAFPPGQGNFIAVYPDWFNDVSLQPTRLLHEAYHFAFPDIQGHNRKKPWRNPYAYQGFISIVGGLKTGPNVDNQFPP